eukprot:gene5000-3595_t
MNSYHTVTGLVEIRICSEMLNRFYDKGMTSLINICVLDCHASRYSLSLHLFLFCVSVSTRSNLQKVLLVVIATVIQHTSMADGDISDQRRRAMKEKIFGHAAGDAPSEGPRATTRTPQETAAQEAFILQELLSRKRRREAEEFGNLISYHFVVTVMAADCCGPPFFSGHLDVLLESLSTPLLHPFLYCLFFIYSYHRGAFIFMSCGGSATSGHGLTGHQVRCALKVLVDDIAVRASEPFIPPGDLASSHYAETTGQTVTVASPGTAPIRVTNYAGSVFRSIRELSGVTENAFAREWDLSTVEMRLGAGRSNALFFPSVGRVFLCKTIALHEVEVLLKILPSYTKHLLRHPGSFLTRFFLLMKVEVEEEAGYITCFHDVCAKATRIHEKWDIKGRMPKPGKYLFDPSESPNDGLPRVRSLFGGEESPEPDAEEEIQSPLGSVGDLGNTQTMHGATVTVRKDKELNRLFWLKPAVRTAVLEQLHADYEYLGSIGLMDYSLFIAVSHSNDLFAGQLSTIRRFHDPGQGVEERTGGREGERRCASPGVREQAINFSDGIPSFRSQELYYIGIIDMLTEYTYKKKIANFCKSFLWREETLSTIPPLPYKERVERFSRAIFPQMLVPSPSPLVSSPLRTRSVPTTEDHSTAHSKDSARRRGAAGRQPVKVFVDDGTDVLAESSEVLLDLQEKFFSRCNCSFYPCFSLLLCCSLGFHTFFLKKNYNFPSFCSVGSLRSLVHCMSGEKNYFYLLLLHL